jgi:hypothetical protein
MTRSSVEADEVALEAWRSTIPYIYNAIENDDLIIIDDMRIKVIRKDLTAFQKAIHLTK